MEALMYQMEQLLSEQKDKIPDEEKEVINKLMADGKALKDKEDVTKEEIDKEIESIEKEFQTIFQKYQVAPSEAAPDTDNEIEGGKEEGAVEAEVIDADEDKKEEKKDEEKKDK